MLDLKEENLFNCSLEKLKTIINDPHFPEAKNYMIIIAFPKFKGETAGGIILTETSFDALKLGMNCGRIVSIGGTVGTGKGGALDEAKTYQLGDWVHFRPHTGYPINHYGEMFYVLKDEDITVRIKNYATITDNLFSRYPMKENHE
jgi:co-chaperonin GroES (HSP10)